MDLRRRCLLIPLTPLAHGLGRQCAAREREEVVPLPHGDCVQVLRSDDAVYALGAVNLFDDLGDRGGTDFIFS